MHLNIKKRNLYFAILFVLSGFLMLRTGCVESVTDTSGTSSTAPTIEIASPVTGDTVYVGTNEISYSATDPSGSGITNYKVYINGNLANTYNVSATSTTTKIYLEIPSTFLLQKISYYVIVTSNSGKTKTSKTETGIYVLPAVPKAPGKLRIAKESDTKFNLTWIDSSDNENRFEVWRKDGGTGSYKLLKSLTANQFYTEDIVQSAYIIYFYKVRAGHATGVSAFSNEVNTLIAPSNLVGKSTAVNTVQLTWTDNSAFETGFRIERALSTSTEFEWIGSVPTNVTTYDDNTVQAATTYKYRIAAYTTDATSPYSPELSVTTPATDNPPSQLSANFNYSTRKVDVTWYSSNYNITTYVERKNGYNGTYSQVAALNNITLRKFSDSLLTEGNFYFYRVRELNYAGLFTTYSNEDTAYVPILPPVKPSDLILGRSSTYVFNFMWTDNSNDEEGFKLYRKTGVNGIYQYVYTFPANWHAGSYTLDAGNDPNAVYYFKMTSFSGTLESDFSNEVSSSSLGVWALSVDFVTTNSIKMRWIDNFSNEVFFSLERKMEGGTYQQVALIPAVSGSGTYVTYIDNSGLLPGLKYYYRVRAVFNQGYSEYSNEISATTSVL